jgi:pimeloyl-ACP methyl ester carboxylesterase
MVAMSSVMDAMGGAGRLLKSGLGAAGRARSMGAPRSVVRSPGDAGIEAGSRAGAAVSFVEVRAGLVEPLDVAYERQGSGDPVVLLHGLGLNRRAWDAVVPALADEREVITIDLPGFGQSPDWPAGLPRDLPTTSAMLDAVFAALGVSRPHVVGHSLGGLIGLRLAQDSRARSVISLAPAGFWNEPERRYAFAVLATARRLARIAPDVVAERLSATAPGRVLLAGMLYAEPIRCPPGAVVACLHSLRDAPGFEATLRAGRAPGLFTGQITGVPVMLAWGTEDRILPPWQARRAAAMLPQARLVWLPGCGHVPMNDAPDTVARLVLDATDPGAADHDQADAAG